MPDLKDSTETPKHQKLIDFISDKYYNGGDKNKLSAKILSSKDEFDKALSIGHQNSPNFKEKPFEEYKKAYISKNGDPFQKKSPDQGGNLGQSITADAGSGLDELSKPVEQPAKPLESPGVKESSSIADVAFNDYLQKKQQPPLILAPEKEHQDLAWNQYAPKTSKLAQSAAKAGEAFAQKPALGLTQSLEKFKSQMPTDQMPDDSTPQEETAYREKQDVAGKNYELALKADKAGKKFFTDTEGKEQLTGQHIEQQNFAENFAANLVNAGMELPKGVVTLAKMAMEHSPSGIVSTKAAELISGDKSPSYLINKAEDLRQGIEDNKVDIPFDSQKNILDNPSNPLAYSAILGQGLGVVLQTYATGGLGTAANLSTKGMTVAQLLGGLTTATSMTYQSAKDNGLSDNGAASMSLVTAPVVAGLDMIGMGKIVNNSWTQKILQKTGFEVINHVTDNFTKKFTPDLLKKATAIMAQKTPDIIKRATGTATTEGVTEGIQEAHTVAMEAAYNNYFKDKDEKGYNIEGWQKRVLNASASGTAMGGVFGLTPRAKELSAKKDQLTNDLHKENTSDSERDLIRGELDKVNEELSVESQNQKQAIDDQSEALKNEKAVKTTEENGNQENTEAPSVQEGQELEEKLVKDGEVKPTTATGTKPEVTEQKTPDSEGDSSETNQEEVIGSESPKKERQAYTKAKEDPALSEELKDGVKEEATVYDPETHDAWDKEADDVFKKGLDEAKAIALDPKSDVADPARVKLIKKLFTEYDRLATVAKKSGDKALESENRAKAVELLENRTIKGTELGKTLASYHDPSNTSPSERLYNIQKQVSDQRNEALQPHEEHIGNVTKILNKANQDAIQEVLNHPKIQELIGKKVAKSATPTTEARKKTVKDAIVFLESKKINLKGKALDVTYAIPAHIYNGAISTIQVGIQAGHTISKALKSGIAYINKHHKGEWDKEGFSNQFDTHLKKYEGHLDPEKAIASALKDKGASIAEIVKGHYTKADEAKKSIVDKLVNESGLDESSAKELAKEIESSFDKLSTKAKQDAIKKAKTQRKKGIPKSKQSIDAKLIELSNTGAIHDEQARQMYAEQLGIKDITKQESERIIDLGEKIQEADVFAEETKKNFTDKNIKKHVELQSEKQKALNEIADILESKKPKNVWDTLSTIMQGNLLSPISLVTNVYSNALLQPLRFLAKLPGQLADIGYSKITGKPRMIDMWASSKGYKTGLKIGAIEGYKQLKTGADIQELQKLEVSRGFKPLRALMDGLSKKKSQALSERINNLIEGTFGMPAEGFFRALNFGDKPFQRANEMAKAYELASLKGLKGEDMQKFLLFPDPESATLIKAAGEEATFKGDNEVSKVASNFLLSIQKGLGKLPIIGGPLKVIAKSQTPFVKTPLNIIMETLDFAVPPLSISKAIYYGVKKGDRVKALEYMGKAMVGVMIQAVADKLFESGIITGSAEDEKKERSLQYQANPPEGINISALQRLCSGGDPSMQKQDTWITYNKMGVMGVIFKMRATAGQNKKDEGVEFNNAFEEILHDTFSSVPSAASSALELSFLQGTNTLLTAVKDGKYDDWLTNTFNAVSSIALPNTLASVNRATRQELPELRDENLSTRFVNVLKSKVFMTGDLPSKIDLWGEPIKQTPEGRNSAMYHLFDVTKARQISADQTSYDIFKLWQETKDSDVIPSIPGKTQSYDQDGESVKVKLTPKQYERLQMYVGQSRKALVGAYLTDNEDSNEDKIETLKDLYKEGLENGKDQFFTEAIEFNDQLNLIKK